MTQWTPADQAFEYVLAIELVEDVARRKLHERIQKGEIPGRASKLTFAGKDQVDVIVPSNFWNTGGQNASVVIDFATRSAVRKYYSFFQRANTPIVPESISYAYGLEFSTRHLQECFPQGLQRPQRPPGTGLAAKDKPLVARMQKLISENAISPTAAAWEVVGADGKGASGGGTPDSKVTRLVNRLKATPTNRE
jgi:hypothetical protein